LHPIASYCMIVTNVTWISWDEDKSSEDKGSVFTSEHIRRILRILAS